MLKIRGCNVFENIMKPTRPVNKDFDNIYLIYTHRCIDVKWKHSVIGSGNRQPVFIMKLKGSKREIRKFSYICV